MAIMELNIERNPHNGGLCCYFEHKGKKYYADLCEVPYADYTECMIFDLGDDDQLTVKNAGELYCKRNIPVTEAQLTACIKKFIRTLR